MTAIQITALVDRALHTAEADTRIRIAGAPSHTCAIAPAALAHLFATDPAAAWLTLAALTDKQLVVEAIDYASWLNETSGRDLAWTQILDVFERRIRKLIR